MVFEVGFSNNSGVRNLEPHIASQIGCADIAILILLEFFRSDVITNFCLFFRSDSNMRKSNNVNDGTVDKTLGIIAMDHATVSFICYLNV